MNPTNPYDTIQQLREQVAAQAAVIEKLREALESYCRHHDECSCNYPINSCDCGLIEALAIPTDSTQVLAEVRRAEREECAKVCDERRVKFIETGWPAYEKKAGDCAAAIRAME